MLGLTCMNVMRKNRGKERIMYLKIGNRGGERKDVAVKQESAGD